MRLPVYFVIPILLFVSSCITASHQAVENTPPNPNKTSLAAYAFAAQPPGDAKSEWQRISGSPGVDDQYASGYIDFAKVQSFLQGEQLRLKIGGTAQKVVVRLLPSGGNPTSAIGVLDEYSVPKDRVLILRLSSAHVDIRQLSVHGGPKPWDLYDLGGGNGPATLLSAERKAP
jgi:hypothetical protein